MTMLSQLELLIFVTGNACEFPALYNSQAKHFISGKSIGKRLLHEINHQRDAYM